MDSQALPWLQSSPWTGTCWEAEKKGGGLRASVSPAGNRADVLRVGKSGEVWRGEHHLGSVTAWEWGPLSVLWTLGS